MFRVPTRPMAISMVIVTFILILITVHFTGASEQLPDSFRNFLETGSSDTWATAKTKYVSLTEDKFTIAIQTYQRPKELNDTLNILLGEKIPSLEEIVVVWNDLEAVPPQDFTSEHGIPVRYRVSRVNSLNEKLWPDPKYKTQAILLSDDDVYYRPEDLEFAFQTWRKFGKNRLTGALARCAVPDKKGGWKYTMCSGDSSENNYAMILTNLCFSHISMMEYYSSDEPVMVGLRKYIDEHFNCEDIALNFVQSHLTREGPLLVNGVKKYVNYVPKAGISTKPGHLKARSQCLNDFENMFGYMPLINETGYMQRGVLKL